jgi:CheY-like chemotaxis protein
VSLQSSEPFCWKRKSSTGRKGKRYRRPSLDHRRDSSARQPILVWIDDYEPGLILYKALFENLGFRVLTASHGGTGLDLVATHPADAVVVDYEMPEMDGGAVAASIRHSQPDLPIVMFSGSLMLPRRVRNLVDAVCDKAGSSDQLLATIQRVLGNQGSSRPVPSAIEAEHALRAAASGR